MILAEYERFVLNAENSDEDAADMYFALDIVSEAEFDIALQLLREHRPEAASYVQQYARRLIDSDIFEDE